MTEGLTVSLRPATLGARTPRTKSCVPRTIVIPVPTHIWDVLKVTDVFVERDSFHESLDEIPPALYRHRGFLYGH